MKKNCASYDLFSWQNIKEKVILTYLLVNSSTRYEVNFHSLLNVKFKCLTLKVKTKTVHIQKNRFNKTKLDTTKHVNLKT